MGKTQATKLGARGAPSSERQARGQAARGQPPGQTGEQFQPPFQRQSHAQASRTAIDGVVVGVLLALRADGKAMVSVVTPEGLDERLRHPIFATCAAAIQREDLGRRVALLFEQGDAGRPLIIALMHEVTGPVALEPGATVGRDVAQLDVAEANVAEADVTQPDVAQTEPLTVRVDGDEVHVEGKREVVLSCGKASITLTRAGKIILHGTYVVSRSSGVNRIKGGSVQIN